MLTGRVPSEKGQLRVQVKGLSAVMGALLGNWIGMRVVVAGALNAPVQSDVTWSYEWVHPVGSDGTSMEDSVFLAGGKALYSKVFYP